MRLYDAIQRIPAGMLLIPTIIGALIHTLCPQMLELGNPTQMLFTQEGMQCCVGLMLFFTGTQLRLDRLGSVVRGALPTLAFKYAVAYGLALAYLAAFGLDGVFGVSFLAFATALTSCNSVLFLAILRPYAGAVEHVMFSVLTVLSMPIAPLILLNGAGGGGVAWASVVSVCVPFALGIALGNADARFRRMFEGGTACILPFFGFQFGSLVDLREAFAQVPQGLALTVAFYALSAVPLFAFERRLLGRPGHVGVASCSVAGIAVSFPTMAAAASAVYAPYVGAAVSQLALVMFVTTFATPYLAQAIIRRRGIAPRKAADDACGGGYSPSGSATSR